MYPNHENADVERVELSVLEEYLGRTLGSTAEVLELNRIGAEEADDVKRFGYGTAFEVIYQVAGRRQHAVFQTVRPGPHGHETMPDRAQLLLSNHETFSRLPRHARSLDVGVVDSKGALQSLADASEFFILTEHILGAGYQNDFFRMRDGGDLTEGDVSRADGLCDYLVGIHTVGRDAPGLYRRRIRELVGHGECIMGLTDGYPEKYGFIDRRLLEEIEHKAVAWRWRLRDYTHRLRQVHGDFHPWNILFDGDEFHVLDRSRGEWGEPADDVSCMTINYLFFSLQRSGRLEGCFETLFTRFWSRYLGASGDEELLSVVAPFFAFRGLVIASPVWYPSLTEPVRRAIFAFIRNVLDSDRFDPARVNEYCER